MTLDLLKERGCPLERQRFTWKELSGLPYSKLNTDAFTRVRVILMNGIESEAIRFQHVIGRFHKEMRPFLARIRRVEQHQQTLINWLNPSDQSTLETTIGYEQVAIEVTASIAQNEPDPYLAQVYRFGLLEDFDHLYRYTALLDRLEGKDANNILQNYTDMAPGRPTWDEHRHPEDDLRDHYDRKKALFVSKLNALTLISAEYQTHDFYMHMGPTYADPVARQLYAEIASVEEQHVTQYESMLDPSETPMEQWLLHEANEVYNYHSCLQAESDPRMRAIWERFLDYELGHLSTVRELFEASEGRDAAEVIDSKLPASIAYESQREFVRSTLEREINLRANGPSFVEKEEEPARSKELRDFLNSHGSPSKAVSDNYVWTPGTELAAVNF